ncbi:beta-ketoacyl-[acyl-carrier-protein] synthase family protein [Amycolatopsis anabasis]|uniref:beta-ketoacyl-[acyl-carrier-protein] synthase family protein n=1 Tax=Amycolatopsis anabasis TaxID=1840409 RepID=UPI001C5557A3|nr:beta-ketoacyl-[acyl-carrier-protein] synthase family protein [Amycolatopsis anabasis]
MNAVAIVGTGAVTALGGTAADLWEGAVSGRVAIRPAQHLDLTGYRTKVLGEVDVRPDTRARYRRFAAHRDRVLDLALAAAEEAMAALPPGTVAPERLGVVLGTCNAGLLSAQDWLRADDPDPDLLATLTPQSLAEAVAAAFSARGPVLAVNTACASGAGAIGLAADLVRRGRADAVLAGGVDALSETVIAGFNALESLSAEPMAPYSATRDGLSLGEGSGMVLLVSPRADLPALAEVLGYGLAADGYHVTAPRPDGASAGAAIGSALRRSGVAPGEVGYVNGHGTGTPRNDPAETRAIRHALGPAADRVLVSSTKSVIGHLLGAAGAVEAIVTARALAERTAPPTAGYVRPDPECDLDYVPGGPRSFDREVAVSTNFAFGGVNTAIVLGRPGRSLPEPVTGRVVVTGVAVLGPDRRVEVDPEPYLDRRARRRMDRLAVFGVVAAARALADAGFAPGTAAVEDIGVLFGTGLGPMADTEKFMRPLLAEGVSAAHPGVFVNTVFSQAPGQIATRLGLRGPTSTLSAGHAAGAAAIGYAADLLACGHADALVAVAADTLTDEVLRAYAARCPGLPLAEGSVALVLERRDAARARGARILGEILGSGCASDARRAGGWDARGRGAERAMRAALRDGGRAPSDVDGVWLAAAGLASADRAESLALGRVFDPVPECHAPKRVLGEPLGVGGALSLALALRSPGLSLVNSASLGGTHLSLLAEGRQP